jgi:hypothetical protein
MSIDTILSHADTSGSARINSIPELVSDHSSPEDMEIDFTHAFKPATQVRSISKADRCGFCEDGGKCICAEAEAEISMSMPQSLPVAPIITTTKTAKPGTCLQCQQNPEQKAYCESLARSRIASRGTAEGEPAAKRTRRDVQVPCADAYEIYQRYSMSKEPPSYDEIYQDYVKSHPGSRRGAPGVVNPGPEPRQRQFSAYETDIAAVIATLHRHPASGVKKGGPRRGGEKAKS